MDNGPPIAARRWSRVKMIRTKRTFSWQQLLLTAKQTCYCYCSQINLGIASYSSTLCCPSSVAPFHLQLLSFNLYHPWCAHQMSSFSPLSFLLADLLLLGLVPVLLYELDGRVPTVLDCGVYAPRGVHS